MSESQKKSNKAAKCPICERPASAEGEHFPFCTARCRQIDLGKWLKGEYLISRPVEQRDWEEGMD